VPEAWARSIKILASHLSSSPELIGSQDGTDYLVMEFLDGQTLPERLRKGAVSLKQRMEREARAISSLNHPNIILTLLAARLFLPAFACHLPRPTLAADRSVT
jgi:hypothetical protein